MTCDPSKICPICDQKGLPILPVRYNVANIRNVHPDARPQTLRAPFSASSISLPSATAQYTMRTLREGYLYTYHHKRNEWRSYVIAGDGNFLEFRMGTQPPKLDGAEPCSRMASSQTGRYIVIPDAHRSETLGAFWMCFSPVAWTRETWKMHGNESYRNRHMRRIDLATWVKAVGTVQPHVAELYGAMPLVADFHLASGHSNANAGLWSGDSIATLGTVKVLPGDFPFEHSLVSSANNLMRRQVEQLSAQMRYIAGQIAPKASGLTPMLVALDDPIAMTADLNQLVLKHIADWQSEPDRKEKFETAQLVTALRASVQNGAVVEEQEWQRTKTVAAGVAMRTIFGRAHTSGMVRPEDLDSSMFTIEDVREIQRLGNEGWEKYKKHLVGGGAYESYLKTTYPDELKKLTADILDPLDNAYISWFDSTALRECMECNFDSNDIASGVQYQEAVCAMLKESTGRARIFSYVGNRIKEDPAERKALIMRALAWNNDAAISRWNAIANQPAAPTDWAPIGGNLFSALKEVVEKGASGELSGFMSGTAKCLYQLSGPVASLVGDVIDGLNASGTRLLLPHKRQVSLMAALAKSENPKMSLVDLSFNTHPNQAARGLSAYIASQSGLGHQEPGFRSSTRRAINPWVKVDQASGAKSFSTRMVVLVDETSMGLLRPLRIDSHAMAGVRSKAVQGMLTPMEYDVLFRNTVAKVNGFGVKSGLVGSIFAFASLGQLRRDYEDAVKNDPSTAIIKAANYGAGIASLVGIGVETIGARLGAVSYMSERLGAPMGRLMHGASTRAAVVVSVGRWIGLVGGFISGTIMIRDGFNSRIDPVYSLVSVGLGFLAIAAGGMLFFSWAVPVAIIILIVSAIVGFFIAKIKPDDIQIFLDKVLHWGLNVDGRFATLEVQNAGLVALQNKAKDAERDMRAAGVN